MDKKSEYKLKFIHASDIHLGSVMHINFIQDEDIPFDFNSAVYDAFRKITFEAIRNSVDFIILAGDVYDRELRTVKASKVFYEECKKLEDEGINIYLVWGNHDSMGQNKEIFSLPKNVHVFNCEKPEVFEIYKENKLSGRIVGQSYKSKWEGKKIFKDFNVEDNGVYNIAVLHTGLEKERSNYIPCSIEELKAMSNINYWALGHIHKHKILNSDKPFIGYPGIPQGRDIGEEGNGGCFLVGVKEDFSQDITYISTSSFIWRREIINIDKDFLVKLSSLNELEDKMIERGEEIISNKYNMLEEDAFLGSEEEANRGYIIHWQIEGRGELNKILREDEEDAVNYLKERFNNHFARKNKYVYTDMININTLKEIELEYLNSTNEIVKEMKDVVKGIFDDSNIKEELIRSFGSVFEEYNDVEDMSEERLALDEELIKDILEASQELIIEKLLETGENY